MPFWFAEVQRELSQRELDHRVSIGPDKIKEGNKYRWGSVNFFLKRRTSRSSCHWVVDELLYPANPSVYEKKNSQRIRNIRRISVIGGNDECAWASSANQWFHGRRPRVPYVVLYILQVWEKVRISLSSFRSCMYVNDKMEGVTYVVGVLDEAPLSTAAWLLTSELFKESEGSSCLKV